MLTRRGFGGCAVCAALGSVAAPAGAQEQEVGRPAAMGGVTRTVVRRESACAGRGGNAEETVR
jgi:hypothetical protein